MLLVICLQAPQLARIFVVVRIPAGERRPVPAGRHGQRRIHGLRCSLLVTADGVPVPEATGAVRAGAPLQFPTETVKASEILPDLDKYRGPHLEFGRIEPTASDPTVQQQYGMIVGKAKVKAASVIVLTMEYRTLTVRKPSPRWLPSAMVYGKGKAVVVSGPSSAKAAWSKPGQKLVCNVTDSAGYQVRPQPGTAWVIYAPSTARVAVT